MKLVRFLMKLNNEKVQVELKNGTIISGEIISVSPTMNINLQNVKMTIKDRSAVNLQFINVRGNQVRMVVLPDDINLDNILTDSMLKPKKLSTIAPKPRSGSRIPTRGGPSRGRGGRGRARAF